MCQTVSSPAGGLEMFGEALPGSDMGEEQIPYIFSCCISRIFQDPEWEPLECWRSRTLDQGHPGICQSHGYDITDTIDRSIARQTLSISLSSLIDVSPHLLFLVIWCFYVENVFWGESEPLTVTHSAASCLEASGTKTSHTHTSELLLNTAEGKQPVFRCLCLNLHTNTHTLYCKSRTLTHKGNKAGHPQWECLLGHTKQSCHNLSLHWMKQHFCTHAT